MNPVSKLVLARLVLSLLAAFVAGTAAAQNFTILHSFPCGDASDGTSPTSSLVSDSAGNLYGTTSSGGSFESGTVFKLSPDGTETVLYSFTSTFDGQYPKGNIVRDSDGNLYGTTAGNGHASGTVFKLTPDGSLTVLHTFHLPPDGSLPYSGLVQGKQGDLYGATYAGGEFSEGTIFRVSTAGDQYTVLHSFKNDDGTRPDAPLVTDSAGNLYGAASRGGTSFDGTIFELDAADTFSVLHSFAGPDEGDTPLGITRDSAGNIYGVTANGGQLHCYGCGSVFKIDPAGNETILYNFKGDRDGAEPSAPLVEDASGNLYGITSLGGSTRCDYIYGCGTLFQVTQAGRKRTLHIFTGPDGYDPAEPLLLDHGSLYGTTVSGGELGCGTIFQYTLQ